MKVWIVIKTSYSPNYSSDGDFANESRSVVGVYSVKKTAQSFVQKKNKESSSDWSPKFEIDDENGIEIVEG